MSKILSGFHCEKASTQHRIDNHYTTWKFRSITWKTEPPLEPLDFCSTWLQCLGSFSFFSAPASILSQHLPPSHDPGIDASGWADYISSSGLAFVCHAVAETWYLVDKMRPSHMSMAFVPPGYFCCLDSSKSSGTQASIFLALSRQMAYHRSQQVLLSSTFASPYTNAPLPATFQNQSRKPHSLVHTQECACACVCLCPVVWSEQLWCFLFYLELYPENSLQPGWSEVNSQAQGL